LAAGLAAADKPPAPRYIRVNQVGYLSADPKVALAFSNDDLNDLSFSVVRASDGALAWGPTPFPADRGAYDPFVHTYPLDFSAWTPVGSVAYKLKLSDGTESLPFKASSCAYDGLQETVLNFFLSQRCGQGNRYAGGDCHLGPGSGTSRMDGRVVGGPHDKALIDVSGGWHDSGDYIKFMVTTGWTCENLLLAYRENPAVFADKLDTLGRPKANGVPDVLDEAKVALDWILKMNPDAGTLYYQVGGEADHALPMGTLPQKDKAHYETGRYRPVYFGNGANTCGKAATSLALGAQIWKARGKAAYAKRCLAAAIRIYALGKATASIQSSNPPGYYGETDWHDDMEWAAAELFRATGTPDYLTDAVAWADLAKDAKGQLDWNACNFLAHTSLYPLADAETQVRLKGYLDADLAADQALANGNPYSLGTRYVWGSMEALTGVVAMTQLYKKRFNNGAYESLGAASRDFILGKNPWGVCFIVGLGAVYPHHPQHNIAAGRHIDIPGMPIEGPDGLASWRTQKIPLVPDDYAAFQSTQADGGIYHDDVNDYATNECTITQAGPTVLIFAELASACTK
jgi:hypothetical protein